MDSPDPNVLCQPSMLLGWSFIARFIDMQNGIPSWRQKNKEPLKRVESIEIKLEKISKLRYQSLRRKRGKEERIGIVPRIT